MSPTERYLRDVIRHVPAAFPERRGRIAEDLRSHLAESVEAGESEAGVVRRMGPPEQTAATFLEGAPLEVAPVADRVGAYLLDHALFLAPLIAAFALLGPRRVAELDDPGRLAGQIAAGLVVAASIGISLLYFPLCEARLGQTPGKRLFGVVVVRTSGTAVRFGAALLRRLPSLFEFALLDALFVPFNARRQRAFDMVAGTMVVRSPRPPRRVAAWAVTGVLVAVAAMSAARVLGMMGGAARPDERGARGPAAALHTART